MNSAPHRCGANRRNQVCSTSVPNHDGDVPNEPEVGEAQRRLTRSRADRIRHHAPGARTSGCVIANETGRHRQLDQRAAHVPPRQDQLRRSRSPTRSASTSTASGAAESTMSTVATGGTSIWLGSSKIRSSSSYGRTTEYSSGTIGSTHTKRSKDSKRWCGAVAPATGTGSTTT